MAKIAAMQLEEDENGDNPLTAKTNPDVDDGKSLQQKLQELSAAQVYRRQVREAVGAGAGAAAGANETTTGEEEGSQALTIYRRQS